MVVLVLASCRAKDPRPGPRMHCSTEFPKPKPRVDMPLEKGFVPPCVISNNRQWLWYPVVEAWGAGCHEKHRSFPARSVERTSRGWLMSRGACIPPCSCIVYRPASAHGSKDRIGRAVSSHLGIRALGGRNLDLSIGGLSQWGR